MDQVALRLAPDTDWTYLGGDREAKKPLEVVVRAFEGDVLFSTGDDAQAPGGEAIDVPVGEGRRLTGRHFFVRPKDAGTGCLLSYRGV